MSTINERIKERRLSQGLTLLDVAEFLAVKEATAQRYESGDIKNIKHETIAKLAELFKCTPAYLMGWEEEPQKPYYELNDKDERDIAKDLERIMNNLDSNHALAFYGEETEFDEEAKEMLRIQLEQTMRMAKQMAKKKFTPKKYRKE